jgi:hypothetical protein
MNRFKIVVVALIALASINGLWANGKDFLFSLAVPGSSQINNGKNYGYAMLAAEALLIGGRLYLKNEADMLIEESYTYAVKYANITPGDYDSSFFKNMGKYDSSGFDAMGYNATIRAEAIYLYPDDPEARQQYINEHAYGEDRYWYWESPDHKAEYNRMRNDSADMESFAKLALGVTILNHLVSGIDVLRYNAQESRAQFSLDYRQHVPQIKLSVKF